MCVHVLEHGKIILLKMHVHTCKKTLVEDGPHPSPEKPVEINE